MNEKTPQQAQRKLTPFDGLKLDLQKMSSQFESVLPAHVTVQKFIRVVLNALQTNPALVNADRRSFFSAALKAATDGLLPDGRDAALVHFNSKGTTLVAYMPMISGILKKVRNSGELLSLSSNVVYSNDDFRYWITQDGENINHEPNVKGPRGEFTLAYALAKTKDGGTYIEVMSKEEIEQVRNVSKAKNGPWDEWFGEMARKTVVRRLSKRLPMSTDLESAIHADDDLYEGGQAEKNNEVKRPGKTRLKQIMMDDDEIEDAETLEHTPELPKTDKPKLSHLAAKVKLGIANLTNGFSDKKKLEEILKDLELKSLDDLIGSDDFQNEERIDYLADFLKDFK